MADEIIKIQELPETNTVADSNVLPIVQGGVTYKIPYGVLKRDAITRAESAAEIAEAAAQTAEAQKESAEAAAENAAESATNAEASATAAESAKDDALTAKNAAESSEANAAESAVTAESWAVGGTETRELEDIDNSKFYAQAARQGATKNGWVYFYIDEAGYLHYRKTSNSDLQFYIEQGWLHVILGLEE